MFLTTHLDLLHMLYKATLDRSIVLPASVFDDDDFTREMFLCAARKQLCDHMDAETRKELVWISSIDFDHLEKNNEATLEDDGNGRIEIRFVALLRMLSSGEKTEGIVVQKNEGERALLKVDNVLVVLEDSEDRLIRVNTWVNIRIDHVKVSTLSNGKPEIEARATIIFE